MSFINFFGNVVRKKDVYFKYSTSEQWTGEYYIDGKKIYQVSYNLGNINAFKPIATISNFGRVVRYECSMATYSNGDKVCVTNGTVDTDLFVTNTGAIYINTNNNTRYDVVLTLWYTKTTG